MLLVWLSFRLVVLVENLLALELEFLLFLIFLLLVLRVRGDCLSLSREQPISQDLHEYLVKLVDSKVIDA